MPLAPPISRRLTFGRPDQPRVPAGSPAGGEFASAGGGYTKGDSAHHRDFGPVTVAKAHGDGIYTVKTAAGRQIAYEAELSPVGGKPPTLAPKAAPPHTAKPAPAKHGSLSAAPLPEFAKRVQAIADAQPVKFGDKAYISHVMRDAMAEDSSLTESGFKNKLKAAATAGHVELSRADLSGLHDLPTVAASYVNREPGADATAMGSQGHETTISAHMIRTGIRRHAMSRTDAEPLDVLTFDRSGPAAAVFNAELGPGYELPALGDDRPKEILGEPVTYLMKPMLQVGQVADTDEGRIVITADALEVADKYTRKWIKDGGKPFVPDRHRDFDAKSNLGWIRSTKFDGKTLWGEHALIGKDAKLLAARNDTSVLLRWGFSHGGNVYPLLVEHNAFVPDPKMGGLGGFVAMSREGAEPESVPVYSLSFDRGDVGGHWVTIEGRHILIPDTAGIVPARVKAEAGALKRFTRANLEKAITDHHRDKSGESGEYTAGMERELTDAAGDANDAFRFHRKLPTEIKDVIGENPALRRVFTTTEDAKAAHGADAYSALGDRYIDIAEARAGSPLRQAKAFAHQSGDPEAAFMAHVHDNLPAGGTKALEPVKAGGLRVGDEFTIGGKAHRVAEDEHGFRVLRSHEYGKGDVPLDAVSHVPVDKGSFRRSKVSRRLVAAAGDGIPFSRRMMAFGRGSFDDEGYFRTIDGQAVFFHGTPGHGYTDSQAFRGTAKILARGGTKTVTVAPHADGGHRVTESGPGAGQHAHADHPTAAAAVADARSRVTHAETAAKAKGEHVATLEKVPGPMPAHEGRYIVKPGGFEENGPTGHHVIDRVKGTKDFIPGDRTAAMAHVAGMEARNAASAARAATDPIEANAARARAAVAARHAADAAGVSKRLTEAAGNPTVDTSRQLGMFAKDAAGNPMEIGEKPGQANLFNPSRYDKGPPPKAAPAPKDEPGQIMIAPAVSKRLEAAAAPGEPAKSAGHVGFYRDAIGRTRELYKAAPGHPDGPAGHLRSADPSTPIDPATGQRGGKFEAAPSQADATAASWMAGGKELRRQGGASVFSPRARADVRENARAVLAGNAAPAAPAVSKRLEAASGKGENGGMHPAEANLSKQAKDDLAHIRANPGTRADVLDKSAAKELKAAGLIRYDSSGGAVKVHPRTPGPASGSAGTPPATPPIASTSPAGGTPPAGTPTRHELAERAADALSEKGYNARAWHGDTSHRVYVKEGGKDLGHIAVTPEGKLDGGNLVRQKGTVMGHVSHLPDAQPEAPRRRPTPEGYKDEDLQQHEHDARPRTEHPRFG